MAGQGARSGAGSLTRLLLDTSVLVAHLRGEESAAVFILRSLSEGNSLHTSCVNVAEVEAGVRPHERKAARALLDRLGYLDTTPEAAGRAGRYQSSFATKGLTIPTPDALVAGTARAHGAVLVTHNVKHFPMLDVRVQSLS